MVTIKVVTESVFLLFKYEDLKILEHEGRKP